MSLTTDIANLTGQVTDLTARVSDWIDQADARIQQALHQVPELAVSYYVDQVAGDDTAAGTVDAPLASIQEALDRIGPTRMGRIRLKNDYDLPSANLYLYDNTAIRVEGYQAARHMRLGVHTIDGSLPDPAGNQVNRKVGGFWSTLRGGSCFLSFYDLNIEWPVTTEVVAHDRYSALLGCIGSDGPAHMAVEISRCNLIYPDGAKGAVVGADLRAASLMVKFVTYDAGIAGHWIAGVTAGTPTVDAPHVLSNLTTL